MLFTFVEEEKAPICRLTTWAVADSNHLIEVLAWLYLRKPRHAARVVETLEPGPASLPGRVLENAIRLLSYDVSNLSERLGSPDTQVRTGAERTRDARIEHRDGLLFQHISWIAAHLRFPAARAAPPHVRKADKGFDGVMIEISSAEASIARLVLCEDKASTNPRSLVTSSIWPEIRMIAAGERDIEILDVVTALLDDMTDVDREGVLAATNWERARQYRVALTAGPDQIRAEGYIHLFRGFEDNAIGAIETRIAEVMPMMQVRAFLDDLAHRVIERLQTMSSHV